MVDLVATPRTWKGILVLIFVAFAALFWLAATGLIVWAVVVLAFAAVLLIVWFVIRGITRRGDRRFGGAR